MSYPLQSGGTFSFCAVSRTGCLKYISSSGCLGIGDTVNRIRCTFRCSSKPSLLLIAAPPGRWVYRTISSPAGVHIGPAVLVPLVAAPHKVGIGMPARSLRRLSPGLSGFTACCIPPLVLPVMQPSGSSSRRDEAPTVGSEPGIPMFL